MLIREPYWPAALFRPFWLCRFPASGPIWLQATRTEISSRSPPEYVNEEVLKVSPPSTANGQSLPLISLHGANIWLRGKANKAILQGIFVSVVVLMQGPFVKAHHAPARYEQRHQALTRLLGGSTKPFGSKQTLVQSTLHKAL